MIPITDLRRQYTTLADQILPVVQSVLESGYFIKGEPLKQCEEAIANYLGVQWGIGVNSGTDALILALKALDIGPGDEVITSAMSFLATAAAISLTGATPVFIDIHLGDDCLMPEAIESVLTERTKAIIPVHLHGYPCDMDAIMAIANRHQLYVIEDAAQAIGAEYKGQKIGAIGHLGCFSFFPTKNLGCYGDGGMVVTNHPEWADRLYALREYGCKVKNFQDTLGVNSRLDTLQAAILQVKLPYLDRWNGRRKELAIHYDHLLKDLPITRPPLEVLADTKSVFHHYQCLIPNRDQIQKLMYKKGFECIPYYPCALHLQTLYRHAYQEGDCPHAERVARDGLALPLFPELTESEQEEIVLNLARTLQANA